MGTVASASPVLYQQRSKHMTRTNLPIFNDVTFLYSRDEAIRTAERWTYLRGRTYVIEDRGHDCFAVVEKAA
jgi:hypothetical protein